ncbi:Tubulin epsilon and delta complex protein 2 [Labeo rohita]|uniref:Tubulin epsilon and delta complex protein 2 n=1 Tax=Labeo rohita TaxID=84645 RepID=A0ABQ8MVJ6_LABRO|nr:Tubulin epsilon and delta complex protein 2 [Labeo rohita]
MSLLYAVEEAVKMCKVEESRLTENTRQCKEILRSMKTRVTVTSELESAAAIDTREDIPPEEKQEIDLLEQVLKKALKIRSTSEVHKDLHSDSKHPNESKNKTLVNYTVKEEDKRKLVKSVPPSEMCKKPNHHRRAGGNAGHGAPWTRPVLVRKGPNAHSVFKRRPSLPKSAPMKISSTESQQKMCVKTTNAKESSEDNFPSVPCQEVPASGKDWKITTGSTQSEEQWFDTVSFAASLAGTENKTEPFLSEWPSRSPAAITTDLDLLTQRCLDLTHCFHAELQAQKDSDSGTRAWGRKMEGCGKTEVWTLHEREYESLQMLKGLERMTAELITCADHQKKDWERWDVRISGALCPVRRRGERGDPAHSCLPPILSYSTEAELRELESRRLRVEQLQQAVRLQQAMSDSLASYWSSRPGAGRPSAVVLRGLYSLLAEGGVQFPSLVLDSESD